MIKQKKPGNIYFNLTLMIIAFAITALCTLTSVYFQDGYNLKVGMPSDRRYKAPRKIENTFLTERNREEAAKAAANMKPIIVKDPAIDESVINDISNLFMKVDDIRAVYHEELMRQAEAQKASDSVVTAETEKAAGAVTPGEAGQPGEAVNPAVTNKSAGSAPVETEQPAGQPQPAASESPAPEKQRSDLPNKARAIVPINIIAGSPAPAADPLMPMTAMEQLDMLQLTLSGSQSRLLLNIDDDHYERLKNAAKQSLKTVLEQGVQEKDAKSLLNIQDELAKTDMTSDMRNIAYQIASSYLKVNYVTDAVTTIAARQEIASQYKVEYIQKDQTIVDEGQIISSETYALLESLGMISNGLQNNILPMISSFALEAILFLLVYVYIKIFKQKLFVKKKDASLLFFIYSATIIAVRLLVWAPYQFLPILLFTMLVAMLIDLRLSIVLNIFISLISMLICKGSIEFLVFFTIMGLAVSLLSKYTTERNQVFIAGIASCLLSFALMFLVLIFFRHSYSQDILEESGYAAGNGILTVIVCLGSLPFWETFFGVITNIKLLDMTNPNNALLRRLIIEAPGTYHHSLVVANLSETAAYEIGADANLARVGGYYHDIGKLKNPEFFSENQDIVAENPHNALTPLESAKIIIEHVRYGIELAGEFKLPPTIKDFIIQHHGATLIQYFYCKAKKESEDTRESDYRYPYIIPQSKETAILMLADTAEAAVRSMKKSHKNINEIEPDIRRLIKAKLDDGQLLDSGLSIKDLDLIAKAFMRVFRGMFHERIEYPRLEAADITQTNGEVSTA